MDSHKMHVQSSTIFSQLWSIHAALYKRHSSFMRRERGFCWTSPFSRDLKERLAVCSLIHSFQNLGVKSLRGMCVLVGGFCFQHMVKWRAMNVLWRKEKKQWGVLISSWQHWVVYSQWNACSWPRTERGQPFLTQELETVAFENEWKKYTFGHVPDGFVVFIVNVFLCPCLDWVMLYFASAFDDFARAFDFSGHSRGMRLVLA